MKGILGLALMLACAGSYAQQVKPDVPRQLRCTAKPVCDKRGVACKSVERTYRGAAAAKAKDGIVQACVQANRPDRCNCIQQCREVSRCSNI